MPAALLYGCGVPAGEWLSWYANAQAIRRCAPLATPRNDEEEVEMTTIAKVAGVIVLAVGVIALAVFVGYVVPLGFPAVLVLAVVLTAIQLNRGPKPRRVDSSPSTGATRFVSRPSQEAGTATHGSSPSHGEGTVATGRFEVARYHWVPGKASLFGLGDRRTDHLELCITDVEGNRQLAWRSRPVRKVQKHGFETTFWEFQNPDDYGIERDLVDRLVCEGWERVGKEKDLWRRRVE